MTDSIDRNAAFALERAQQIQSIKDGRDDAIASAAAMRADFEGRLADGKVRDNGDGTYLVTDPGSWDNNEVWRMQTIPQFGELVLPVSNLDESTGDAALYTRVPAWHGLGTVVPEGISDLSEVLRLGKIDFEVLQTPTLYTRPAFIAASGELVDESVQPIPGSFTNLRSDNGAPLGVVGKVYKPFQPYDAGAFLQDLVNDHGMLFESAGATYGGRHIFVGMRLPDDVEIDLGDGVTEMIRAYLYWLDSNDGTTSAQVTVSPWRVECGNTERFNARDAVARWRTRHTTYALTDARMKEARNTLGKTVAYFRSFKAEEELLARTPLRVAEFESLINEIYTLDADPTDRQRNSHDNRVGELFGMFSRQTQATGRTAYSAERTFTDYLDHAAPKRVTADRMAAARATALIEGTDDDTKNKVHTHLLTLANA
jgi:phage/plasmid-like protein (TIGR03299 family)